MSIDCNKNPASCLHKAGAISVTAWGTFLVFKIASKQGASRL
jgi:hypothetical protein